MGQIKQSQILPEEQKEPNPIVGLPRDFVLPNLSTNSNKLVDKSMNTDNTSITPIVDVEPAPMTPAILSLKEQIVIFNSDGSARVDVILDVEDVLSAVEYDVRVTKSAGTV